MTDFVLGRGGGIRIPDRERQAVPYRLQVSTCLWFRIGPKEFDLADVRVQPHFDRNTQADSQDLKKW